MRHIQGAVAVVTGAASGIGRALAVQLASLGAELALADVNAAGLDETLRLLGSAKARAYTVDVADASAVETFAYAVEKDFGRVSLLVNKCRSRAARDFCRALPGGDGLAHPHQLLGRHSRL